MDDILKDLIDLSKDRRIFTSQIYLRAGETPFTLPYENTNGDRVGDALVAVDKDIDFEKSILAERAAEAGNMAISRACAITSCGSLTDQRLVCGPPLMEREVRRALRTNQQDVELFTSPFQMDETVRSHAVSQRFVNASKARSRASVHV